MRNALGLRARVEAASAGQREAMSDQTDRSTDPARGPDDGARRPARDRAAHAAARQRRDGRQAVEQGLDKLEQAGGGH